MSSREDSESPTSKLWSLSLLEADPPDTEPRAGNNPVPLPSSASAPVENECLASSVYRKAIGLPSPVLMCCYADGNDYQHDSGNGPVTAIRR